MAAIFGAVNFTSVHQAEVEEVQRDFEFEIQELLLTAGYFRARIANLSPFDKVRPSRGIVFISHPPTHSSPRRLFLLFPEL